ncbi:hypothetical protein [Terribacillus saccharophilus]|uniref:hypothetical protein n=1 Tax=Terribacillus saccharophilus TaxID=361277 RepID=UPI002989EACC|nr:hypothetical protein [Terribacillus saccharophilus]MCM3227501.1 hypothetical protein [Terribacillus saccharophilus]
MKADNYIIELVKAANITHDLTNTDIVQAYNSYKTEIRTKLIHSMIRNYTGVPNSELEVIKSAINKAIDSGLLANKHLNRIIQNYQTTIKVIGESKHGVIDNRTGIFYECLDGEQWSTVQRVMNERYPDKVIPFIYFMNDSQLDTFGGVERDSIDWFIMETFSIF